MKGLKKKRLLLLMRWQREVLLIALVGLLILAVGILGDQRILGALKASGEESLHRWASQSESQWESQSASQRGMESLGDETAVHEIKLTDGEEELVRKLSQAFENHDLEGAARILNTNADSFQSLFLGKLADETCLFDGVVMKDEAQGRGLAFQRAGTVFYGDFKAGRPSGRCVALQAVSLDDGVRYDYSIGGWSDGKMEGEGECGYDYYQGISGDGVKRTVKRGAFSADLMEGAITYSSIGGDGANATWSMSVQDGVIVLDDSWVFDEAGDGTPVYRLASDADEAQAYVVKKNDMEKVLWKNMIPWESNQ